MLDLIAAAAGHDAARACAEAFGGRRIYLPREPAADHQLSEVVGHAAAIAICRALGAGHLDVPRRSLTDVQALGRRIVELTNAGVTAAEVARRLGCAQRTVHRWRRKARAAGEIE